MIAFSSNFFANKICMYHLCCLTNIFWAEHILWNRSLTEIFSCSCHQQTVVFFMAKIISWSLYFDQSAVLAHVIQFQLLFSFYNFQSAGCIRFIVHFCLGTFIQVASSSRSPLHLSCRHLLATGTYIESSCKALDNNKMACV